MKIDKATGGNIFTNIFILSIGLLFLLPAAYKIHRFASFSHNAFLVNGTVEKEGTGRFLGSKPFIRYASEDGSEHEFKSEINYYWFFAPNKGNDIEILVLKDFPGSAITNSYLHYIIIPLILFSIGISIVAFLLKNILHVSPKLEH